MNKPQNNIMPKGKVRRCSSGFCNCKERLDSQRILSLFALFTDLPDNELIEWVNLCDSAEMKLMRLLRKSVNIPKNMERLCNAAAAIAYCDYAMLAGGSVTGDIRVGEISVKTDGDSGDAISTRDYMIAEISDLLSAPSGFVFRGMGDDFEKMF